MDVVGGEACTASKYITHATTTGHRGTDTRRETSKLRRDRSFFFFLCKRFALERKLIFFPSFSFVVAQALDCVVLPILNKPKPKVEPPKEEKPKDKDAEEQKTNNQNSQANAHNHTNQQAEQEEKMDVE